jgi:hypothetical protein
MRQRGVQAGIDGEQPVGAHQAEDAEHLGRLDDDQELGVRLGCPVIGEQEMPDAG